MPVIKTINIFTCLYTYLHTKQTHNKNTIYIEFLFYFYLNNYYESNKKILLIHEHLIPTTHGNHI